MRLNKYLALCGVGSRRKCDELIQGEQILVNGEIAHIGQEVNGTEKITINGREIKQNNEYYYYILNKPKGCICTMQDDRGRRTIIDVFNKAYYKKHKNTQPPHLFPVGRLDYNTQGLLILTNDGDFANSLIHPSKKIVKRYKALIYPHLNENEITKLENGVTIDGVKTLPSIVNILQNVGNKQLVEVSISQGRNRQIHKMFEAIGKCVDELERVAIGQLELGDLVRGDIKEMSPIERELVLQNT